MKMYTITLPAEDVLQMLDVVDARAEAWERTSRYLENDYVDPDEGPIEACNSIEEAKAIEEHYRYLAASIRRQIDDR